jgi:hypothetical protein
MTLPSERTRAVLEARILLAALCDVKVTPNVPKIIRERAKMVMRHYPSHSDIELVAKNWNNKLLHFVTECPFAPHDGS